eukprot:Gregarina_sp_Poly_1__764@NODE_1182_length_4849_cov_31_140945_g812_i0_p1_GENE_NODE_1182_length_4849_cov_31_140945_g812_i0NODE_1182_length_4849_cov_31_140945_g812_i0_p1_ORF_typecomplete_len341_score44_29Choline_kinase/PF01633_20/3e36APH/PF01636_23/2_2e10APH/PF01636_23/8_1e02DUF1679/PF07914_11/3_2e06EcKinase/PF02958_20/6e05APH_6_hur/PF04655_14/0_019_NODE_1182_length_4849_cov_31_140945_g812_i018882910
MLDYLSLQGLCKRVFHRFEGGQIDEWKQGRCITLSEMKDPIVSEAIAVQLAALHRVRLPPREASISSDTDFCQDASQTWAQIWTWFDMLADLKAKKVASEILDSINIDALRQVAVKTRINNASFQSPLVLCHNDLLNGNIVRIEDTSDRNPVFDKSLRIEFIDFEYAGVGERGFDIANHFCEMAGFECDYSLLPDEGFQVRFLSCYMTSLEDEAKEDDTRIPASSEECSEHSSSTGIDCEHVTLPPHASATARARTLLPEIQSFVATSHFFWGLWALVQAVQWRESDSAPCDYQSYAHRRLEQLRPTSAIPPMEDDSKRQALTLSPSSTAASPSAFVSQT